MTSDVIVIVCGSRNWTNDRILWARLDALLAEHPGLVIRHGGCPAGADAMADGWCRNRSVPRHIYPANWDHYGKRAGYARNAQMAKAEPKAVLCLAFWDGSSRGTGNMQDEAKRAGIPVETVVMP